LDCNCTDIITRECNVKEHKVIRNYLIAGRYELCGICGRIEWFELSDALEVEINTTNEHCLRSGGEIIWRKGKRKNKVSLLG